MKEQLVSFKTAKLAKEKGFKGHISKIYYIENGTCMKSYGPMNVCREDWNDEYLPEDIKYSVPPQSLLQKWLREKHEIFIIILPQTSKFGLKWTTNFHNRERTIQCWKTYEEAFEVGLQEGLKLMK